MRVVGIYISLLLFMGLFVHDGARAQGDITERLLKVKPPGAYGTIVLDRNTRGRTDVAPVVFPHWVHRARFTCKACHTDLGFAMKAGTANIVMNDIMGGKFCGTCHNGKVAFPFYECIRCHSYGAEVKENKKIEEALKDFPQDDFGNRVNWVKALREGKIKPAATPEGEGEMMVFDLDITITPTKFTPAPGDVLYPHKAHTEVLECGNCHPAVFNMQKGGNPGMSMKEIIAGKYCGTCHGRVAFPLEDCFRCHSQIPQVPQELREQKKEEAPAKEAPKKK